MFFWKILEVGSFERLVCTYCLLKDDMPFVSGSYVIEVAMTTSKNLAFFFHYFFIIFFILFAYLMKEPISKLWS